MYKYECVCVYVCVYINIMGPLSTTLLSVTGIFTIINSNEHNFKIKAMIFLGNVLM